MEKCKNYLGQLRLYSLADLILLLIALQASPYRFAGAIILHIGFLAYLESRHSHSYRASVPRWISYMLEIMGIVFFGKIEGIFYAILGFFYSKKNKNTGYISPFLRGFQNFFIAAGIIGYFSPVAYIVGILFVLRNLAGDFRDAHKDIKEGTRTIATSARINFNFKYLHLVFVILTSAIWWRLSHISIWWLLLVIFIEISTYNLTPR